MGLSEGKAKTTPSDSVKKGWQVQGPWKVLVEKSFHVNLDKDGGINKSKSPRARDLYGGVALHKMLTW